MESTRTDLFAGVKGVLFDLFDTLLAVDPRRLPCLQMDGRPWPSTVPVLFLEVAAALPDQRPEQILIELLRLTRGDGGMDGDRRERSSRELFCRLLERLGVLPGEGAADLACRLSDVQMRTIAGAARPVPGAKRLVRAVRAKGWRTALVSNLEHAAAAPWLLDAVGLSGCFEAVVLSEEIGYRKPDPSMFEAALRQLGLGPGEAVHIGDEEEADIQGASRLGLRTVWLRRNGRRADGPASAATLTVGRLAEVLPYLRV